MSNKKETGMVPGGGTPTGVERVQDQVGAVAAIAEAESEMRGRIFLAKEFPRDEMGVVAKIGVSCQRLAFAKKAEFAFPRGGTTVHGPSVYFAREMARRWGNIHFGLRIVAVTDEEVHIKAFAFDAESNTTSEKEDRFAKIIHRKPKGGGKAKPQRPDERELRELVNRRGAICLRNAILELIPSDIVDEAIEIAGETITAAANGSLKQDRRSFIIGITGEFQKIGVTPQMLEEHLGHALDLLNGEEARDLKGILNSIKEGNSRRDEYFRVTADAPPPEKQPPRYEKEAASPSETPPERPQRAPAATQPPDEKDEKAVVIARIQERKKKVSGLDSDQIYKTLKIDPYAKLSSLSLDELTELDEALRIAEKEFGLE